MATQPPGPALATPPMSPLPTLLCVPPHTPTASADTPRSFLSQGGGSYVLSPLPGPISQVGHVGLSSCHLLQEAFSDQFFQANALYLFPLLKKKKKSPPWYTPHHVTIVFIFTVQTWLPLQTVSITRELLEQCLVYSKYLIHFWSSEGQRPAQTHGRVICIPEPVAWHLGGCVQ